MTILSFPYTLVNPKTDEPLLVEVTAEVSSPEPDHGATRPIVESLQVHDHGAELPFEFWKDKELDLVELAQYYYQEF